MKIIISPAKKMNTETDIMEYQGFPVFMDKTERLMDHIKGLTYEEAKKLWACNDKIARLNYERFAHMDLRRNPTPALLSYEGIQYQYMAPNVFESGQWEFVQEHLRILSGFYGVAKPLDGVVPYRLEMQAKISVFPQRSSRAYKNLYDFWGEEIYKEIECGSDWILNLASKEYSKCIESWLNPGMLFITCVFGELKEGKIMQKGTLAKMARGEMVRYLAAEGVTRPEGLKAFQGLGFAYRPEYSTDTVYTYLKEDAVNEG
ncbi:MAG: peroxide stress protein YaaA [Eubacteriales bacterium]|nr:peroxide stress protein YaaA [Eubacteriales bacterium]